MVHKRQLKLMGNCFEIAVISVNEVCANIQIDAAIAEIKRIEQLLTTFAPDSVTNQINAYAGIEPVIVPDEVFDLISRCQKISTLTQGAFDITYGGVDKRFWNFDPEMKELPSAEHVRQAIRLVDYNKIILNPTTKSVFLKERGMRIGFGAIGKGYAAERGKLVLKNIGVESGFVNAAGDVTVWGAQEDGRPWTVGIAAPNERNEIFSALEITDTAVATSGDYEKYVLIDGKRYSHTIDPRTCFPVLGTKSVTIITPNAELADAMATAVTVMGKTTGMDLVNQMNDIACIIVDDHDEVVLSDNINVYQCKD